MASQGGLNSEDLAAQLYTLNKTGALCRGHVCPQVSLRNCWAESDAVRLCWASELQVIGWTVILLRIDPILMSFYVYPKHTHRWYAPHRLRNTSLKHLWGYSCWTKKKRKVYNSEAENTCMNLTENCILVCLLLSVHILFRLSLCLGEETLRLHAECRQGKKGRREEGQKCLKEGRKEKRREDYKMDKKKLERMTGSPPSAQHFRCNVIITLCVRLKICKCLLYYRFYFYWTNFFNYTETWRDFLVGLFYSDFPSF